VSGSSTRGDRQAEEQETAEVDRRAGDLLDGARDDEIRRVPMSVPMPPIDAA
jgi:hypothetical protein